MDLGWTLMPFWLAWRREVGKGGMMKEGRRHDEGRKERRYDEGRKEGR
jgi:hypothetical protein